MSQQSIESQDLTLGKLFSDFYAVPSFQREYVWEEPQVEQLLQDIYDEFSSDTRSDVSEYFIGSIVVCEGSDGVYDLIDGQQRMTTAYLGLCAIRDYLQERDRGNSIDKLANQIAAADIDSQGRNVFRYRVNLQYEDSCGVLDQIAQGTDLTAITAQTRSVQNIITAYHTIQAFLAREFGGDLSYLKRYYAYFTQRVKLIRVKTASLAHALKVFETINDRGVGLDSMDLLKNQMFIQARPSEFDVLKNEWKKLVDTLYQANEKPLRFLRYFIFARYDVDRLKEDEIYKWFIDNKELCGYEARPLSFVRELLADATAYARFIAGQDAQGRLNHYLSNLRYLSGSARQHLILLLAGQRLPIDLFTELCRQVENLYFAYVITRSDTRDFERLFAKWAKEVRTIQGREQLDVFIASRVQPEKESLAPQFELSLMQLDEQSIQKYRMRYVLAKLTQYVDERAWGSEGPAANLGTYINSRVDIEHILPQTPSAEVKVAFDRLDEMPLYIHRLGNLTLVEKSINCSVGNGLFSDKKQAYRQSNFLLTKSLGEHVQVGFNTAVDRAVQELEDFDEWSSAAIDRRQALLLRLARKTWDMPEPARGAEPAPQIGAEHTA